MYLLKFLLEPLFKFNIALQTSNETQTILNQDLIYLNIQNLTGFQNAQLTFTCTCECIVFWIFFGGRGFVLFHYLTLSVCFLISVYIGFVEKERVSKINVVIQRHDVFTRYRSQCYWTIKLIILKNENIKKKKKNIQGRSNNILSRTKNRCGTYERQIFIFRVSWIETTRPSSRLTRVFRVQFNSA